MFVESYGKGEYIVACGLHSPGIYAWHILPNMVNMRIHILTTCLAHYVYYVELLVDRLLRETNTNAAKTPFEESFACNCSQYGIQFITYQRFGHCELSGDSSGLEAQREAACINLLPRVHGYHRSIGSRLNPALISINGNITKRLQEATTQPEPWRLRPLF